MVAAHYLDAYSAAPDDPDAEEIRATAREMLVRAAERAASLAAASEAQRAYERAIELTSEPLLKAELHERAGSMAHMGARADDAASHYEQAIAHYEAGAAVRAGIRVRARRAEILWERGRLEEALEEMNSSFEALSQEEPDETLASLAAQLGRFMFFADRTDLALQRSETALELAEALALPEVLSQALNTKALVYYTSGRRNEGLALLRYALEVALQHDKPSSALRAYNNLADLVQHMDRYEEGELILADARALAHRVGNHYWERILKGQIYSSYALGKWEEVVAPIPDLLQEDLAEVRLALFGLVAWAVAAHVHRGSLETAELIVDRLAELEHSVDFQERGSLLCGKARLALGRGDAADALRIASRALELQPVVGLTQEYMKETFVTAVEAALEIDDLAAAEEWLSAAESLPPGRGSLFLRAQVSRFRARLADRQQEPESRAEDGFKAAVGLFRELAVPFYLAVTQLEYADWLLGRGRRTDADEHLAEARRVFETLRAAPWLERVDAAGSLVATP